MVSTPGTPTWRDYVEALGPPVYRVSGQEPRASFGAHGDLPTAVSLSFGELGALLVVETSLESIDDRRILTEMIMNVEPTYPLVIRQEGMTVVVDGRTTDFRVLRIEDDLWSATALVGNRCVYLRGIGVPSVNIAIEQLVIG